jgi:hypothetical protein
VGIGTAQAEKLMTCNAEASFTAARRALDTIGTVTEVDERDLFLRGNTKYGLQKVRLKVFVDPTDANTASTVRVKALADDIWGKAARKGCERFFEALGGEG